LVDENWWVIQTVRKSVGGELNDFIINAEWISLSQGLSHFPDFLFETIPDISFLYLTGSNFLDFYYIGNSNWLENR
jgi:hypothetical protein